MRIDSSTVGMESARKYVSSDIRVKKFMITDYQNTSGYDGGLNPETYNSDFYEDDSSTDKALEENSNEKVDSILKDWETAFGINRAKLSNVRDKENNTFTTLKQLSLRYILEMLFPKKHHKLDDIMKDYQDMNENSSNNNNANAEMFNVTPAYTVSKNVLSYSSYSRHYESEETSFSALGRVVTKDGRQIDFNIDVSMSREFVQESSIDLEMVSFSLTDPLIINLDENIGAADVTDQKFYFDINADGEKEEISALGKGSGYLALDKNNDGIINDGTELFGTKSGDGFQDLAQYDEDGNGWIDENDSVWSKLKIWTTNEAGEQVLCKLADKNIGAIGLQNTDTLHTLQDSQGDVKGIIRKTGIFLYETGGVGTLQHVDMASYAKEA